MARVALSLVRLQLPEEAESGVRLVDWLGPRRSKPKGPSRIDNAAWRKVREQAAEMMASAQWGDAKPRHFAAVYEILHEWVYDVLPAELDPKGRSFCALMASQLLRREFDGNCVAMAAYLHWVWVREKERERWRRENGRDAGHISPRLCFGGALLTDYRISRARGHG
jgi:hypothetical protein